MDEFKMAQARIDALFEGPDGAATPVHERICAYAKRGLVNPENLSPQEIQQVCYALVVHYAQMGIG